MRREPPKPEINVTPLVDIVLVLLIIFMVALPQMEAGASVVLPGVKNVDAESKQKLEPVTVSLTASGQVWVEKEQVPPDQVVARLREIHAQGPQRKLLLKGDTAVGYGKMRELFKEVQEVGFPGVALQVNDKSADAKKPPAQPQ